MKAWLSITPVRVLALLPLALSLLLTTVYLRVDFSHYLPQFYRVYNDAIYNWRQAYTFSAVGFDGGYYTVNELPAPASFSHFYAHGPGYPMIYGSIGRIFGWTLTSQIWINLTLVTLALFAVLSGLRPGLKQALLFVICSVAVWPVLIYLLTGMTESLHHATAILFSILMWRLIRDSATMQVRLYVLLISLLTLLTLTRPTWGVLFIPVFMLRTKQWRFWKSILLAVLGFACFAVLFQIHIAVASPYPFLDADPRTQHDLIGFIDTRLERANLNLQAWTQGIPIEVMQRYTLVALLVGIMIWSVIKRREVGREAVFHLMNIGFPLAINLFANDMAFYRDFRAMAPHLLLSLLVLVACRRWWLPTVFIIFQLTMFPAFLTEYRATVEPQFSNSEVISSVKTFQTQTAPVLIYQPNAPSPWCNTLLFIMENWNDLAMSIPPELAFVDPGIGLSFYVGYWNTPPALNFPLKSRYVLLSPSNRDKIGDQANLTLLRSTIAGNIYRNEDRECSTRE
ncbi:MAG: hypothetical protein J0M33_28320 [Anaerolineae bacterium]|nr:hypothetical protein [Anaerolineae bacterium]